MHPYLPTEQIDHVAAAAKRVSAQLAEIYPASAPL